jgi:hypothetical protein
VVHDLEGVRELHAEAAAGGAGRPGEALHHREGVVEARVVPERRVGDLDSEAERPVQERAEPARAEERRVQLHPGVDAHLLEEVAGDPLDLGRRAAVHRREGDVVGDRRGDLDVADPGPRHRDGVHGCGDRFRRVPDRGDEPPDPLAPDPLEVVADAHREERPRRREGELRGEGVEEDPGLEVLVEALLELQLLRPLAVERLVGRVDAGAADLELVEDLDRLQLDEARPAEPGGDDVLRELAVRPGRDAERRRQLPAEEAGGEPGLGPRERPLRDAEDRFARLEVAEDPPREELEGKGTECLFHGRPPRAGSGREARSGGGRAGPGSYFVATKTLGNRARNAEQWISSRVSRHSPILCVFCSMPAPKPNIAGYL